MPRYSTRVAILSFTAGSPQGHCHVLQTQVAPVDTSMSFLVTPTSSMVYPPPGPPSCPPGLCPSYGHLHMLYIQVPPYMISHVFHTHIPHTVTVTSFKLEFLNTLTTISSMAGSLTCSHGHLQVLHTCTLHQGHCHVLQAQVPFTITFTCSMPRSPHMVTITLSCPCLGTPTQSPSCPPHLGPLHSHCHVRAQVPPHNHHHTLYTQVPLTLSCPCPPLLSPPTWSLYMVTFMSSTPRSPFMVTFMSSMPRCLPYMVNSTSSMLGFSTRVKITSSRPRSP